MLGMITDRSQANVSRLKLLSSRQWDAMTPSEQTEWLGDPLTATAFGPVNLMPSGPYVSAGADMVCRNQYIEVTATAHAGGLHSVALIGAAADFEGKSMTLSVDSIESTKGEPRLRLCWYDTEGTDNIDVSLSEPGSVTFTVPENTNGRAYLAMCVHVSVGTAVDVGDTIRYTGVMLEMGSVRNEYVPYTEIVATPATKGAYNYSDMNRVERMVAELSEKLSLGLVTKTDWTWRDIVSEEDETRYLGNIRDIQATYTGVATIPEVPDSMSGMTVDEANDIEKILEIVHRMELSSVLGSMVLGTATIGG